MNTTPHVVGGGIGSVRKANEKRRARIAAAARHADTIAIMAGIDRSARLSAGYGRH